jgi:hypothetical protein
MHTWMRDETCELSLWILMDSRVMHTLLKNIHFTFSRGSRETLFEENSVCDIHSSVGAEIPRASKDYLTSRFLRHKQWSIMRRVKERWLKTSFWFWSRLFLSMWHYSFFWCVAFCHFLSQMQKQRRQVSLLRVRWRCSSDAARNNFIADGETEQHQELETKGCLPLNQHDILRFIDTSKTTSMYLVSRSSGTIPYTMRQD